MSKRAPHTHTEICEIRSDLSTIHANSSSKKTSDKKKSRTFCISPGVRCCSILFIHIYLRMDWQQRHNGIRYNTQPICFILFSVVRHYGSVSNEKNERRYVLHGKFNWSFHWHIRWKCEIINLTNVRVKYLFSASIERQLSSSSSRRRSEQKRIYFYRTFKFHLFGSNGFFL